MFHQASILWLEISLSYMKQFSYSWSLRVCSNTCISSSSLFSVPRSHLRIFGQPLNCSMVSKKYLETILTVLFLGSTLSQLAQLVLLKQNSAQVQRTDALVFVSVFVFFLHRLRCPREIWFCIRGINLYISLTITQ